MLDEFLVSLSPLFLEDKLHGALGVLYDGGVYTQTAGWRDDRVAAESVFARAKLVDGGKGHKVADLDVAYAGDSEKVAGGEDVFSAAEGGDYVSGRLGADELEGGGG